MRMRDSRARVVRTHSCVLLSVPAAGACPVVQPYLLTSWDADSLRATVASNMEANAWNSTAIGTRPLAMVAGSQGGPVLQYDLTGVPYVDFRRPESTGHGLAPRAAWLQSGPYTIPASGTPTPGLTLVVTARMGTSGDAQKSGAWERLLQCADGAGVNYLTLARRGSSNQLTVLWGNAGAFGELFTPFDAISGLFQTFVFRIRQDSAGEVYTETDTDTSETSLLRPLSNAALSKPALTFPRTFAVCYLGKSADAADPSLTGGIREISLYAGAFTNTMMEEEYNRQVRDVMHPVLYCAGRRSRDGPGKAAARNSPEAGACGPEGRQRCIRSGLWRGRPRAQSMHTHTRA